ncbi:Putative LOC101236261, partial [Caligus rogercresseyi]
AISREKQLDCSSILEDHDYCEIPPPLPPTLSSFKAAVISYIAGFVIHKLQQTISCVPCKTVLTDPFKQNHFNLALIKKKDVGGLIYPSQDAITVCQEVER